LFAPSPGFNVHGGVLTGLYGGVIGGGDFTFIDFEYIFAGLGSNGFNAAAVFPPTFNQTVFQGHFTVDRVAEPPSVALLVIGLGILLSMYRVKSTKHL
jgi:hypothetical protein